MQCVWGLLRGSERGQGWPRRAKSGLRGGDFVLGALGSHARAVTGCDRQWVAEDPLEASWRLGGMPGPRSRREKEHTSSRGQEGPD